jgi:hypothetical protein
MILAMLVSHFVTPQTLVTLDDFGYAGNVTPFLTPQTLVTLDDFGYAGYSLCNSSDNGNCR